MNESQRKSSKSSQSIREISCKTFIFRNANMYYFIYFPLSSSEADKAGILSAFDRGGN